MRVEKITYSELLKEVQRFYSLPGNGTGGKLHIVLDDGNIRDSDVQWCLDLALQEGDLEAEKLARLLLKASWTQRRKLTREYNY